MGRVLSAMLGVSLLGCGGGAAGPDTDGGVDAASDGADDAWIVLISKDWTLPAGTEDMPRAFSDVTTDLEIRAIRPLAPPGTHHTLFGITTPMGGDPGTTPDGLIYASGVGTDALYMPPGVGFRIEAGKRLSLQLHLYNTGDEPLSGTSGIEVLLAEPGTITHQADIVLAGPAGLSIPPGTHTVAHDCTIDARQAVFAVFPHMHQLGTHFRAVAQTAAGPVVLHDGAYDFEEQRLTPLTPVPLARGDRITTECTWANPTDHTVGFGSSSDDEMCFSILFRYPAQGVSYCGS